MATNTNTRITRRRVESWRRQYFATFSKANKAVLERARLLAEWRSLLGNNASMMELLTSGERGFGLPKAKAEKEMELLRAFDRYPTPANDLLWDALGDRVVRITRIENANLRRRVKRAVEQTSDFEDGYVSDSKLTSIIRSFDPNYYIDKPGERARHTQRVETTIESLQSDVQALKRDARAVIEALENEGFDGRSFFTRRTLRILDRN